MMLKATRARFKELPDLKIREFKTAVHIGLLENPLQQNVSHEGCLLSASTYPTAWTRIAKLGGGKSWKITPPGRKIRLIDIHHSHTKKTLLAWGIEENLVELQKWWWTPCSTDEEGDVRYCWTQTPDKEEWQDTGKKPVQKKVEVPTTELLEFWDQRLSLKRKPVATPWHAADAVAAAFVVAHQLAFKSPNLDGVFWNEILDPEILSAPRMGIALHPTLQILNDDP